MSNPVNSQTDTDRQTNRQTVTDTDRQTNRQTDTGEKIIALSLIIMTTEI